MGLQGLYFALAVYGWWAWLHGGEDHGELRVSLASGRTRAILAAIGMLAGVVLGQALDRFTDASLPFMDSILTSFSIVAQWMQTRKLLEAWLVWLAVDVFYVGMFVYKGLYLTAGALRGLPLSRGPGLRRLAPLHGAGPASRPRPRRVSMIRVVVTGSECTGKTTLATALAEHYGVAVGRRVRAAVRPREGVGAGPRGRRGHRPRPDRPRGRRRRSPASLRPGLSRPGHRSAQHRGLQPALLRRLPRLGRRRAARIASPTSTCSPASTCPGSRTASSATAVTGERRCRSCFARR